MLVGRVKAVGALPNFPTACADDDKQGKLVFNGREYPLSVLMLPCVTETYKSYDGTNYVKVTDVGQVRCAFCAGSLGMGI